MPAPFWNSQDPIFLDRDKVIDEFRILANAAAIQDARILRVVLFGSLATGRATPRSDADLMIELSDHSLRSIDRIPEYLEAFSRGPLPVDVFPYTQEELKTRRGGGDRFIGTIDSEGIILFDRAESDRVAAEPDLSL